MKNFTFITLVALTLTTIFTVNASAFEYFDMKVVETYAMRTVRTTILNNTGNRIYSNELFQEVKFIKGSYISGDKLTKLASKHSNLHEKVNFSLKKGEYKSTADILITVFEVKFWIKGELKIATGILYASRYDHSIMDYLIMASASKIFNKKNRAFKKAQKGYLKQLAIFE